MSFATVSAKRVSVKPSVYGLLLTDVVHIILSTIRIMEKPSLRVVYRLPRYALCLFMFSTMCHVYLCCAHPVRDSTFPPSSSCVFLPILASTTRLLPRRDFSFLRLVLLSADMRKCFVLCIQTYNISIGLCYTLPGYSQSSTHGLGPCTKDNRSKQKNEGV